IGPSGSDPLSVRMERNTEDLLVMTSQDQDGARLGPDQVPDPDGRIRTGRGELRPIGAEGDAEDGTTVIRQALQRAVALPAGARTDVPDPDGPVLAGRRELRAVRTEGDAPGPALVPVEEMGHFPGDDVPDLEDAVGPGGGQADAVPVEGYAVGGAVEA